MSDVRYKHADIQDLCSQEPESALREQLRELERQLTMLPWRPKPGEDYWCIGSTGTVGRRTFRGDALDPLNFATDNVFQGRISAELHQLRRMSARKICPVPAVGDVYFTVYLDGDTWHIDDCVWENDNYDRCCQDEGTVFDSREVAAAWIEEFGPAWVTPD